MSYQVLVCTGAGSAASALADALRGKGCQCQVVGTLGEVQALLAETAFDAAVICEDLDHDAALILAATVRMHHGALTRILALVPSGDEERAAMLKRIGVAHLLPAGAGADEVHAAIDVRTAGPALTSFSKPSAGEIQTLEAIHRGAPDNPDSAWLLGFGYYKAKRYEDAARLLEVAARHAPSATISLYYLGHCRYKLGDTRAALASWQTVIEQDPSGPLAAKARQHVQRS